MVNISITVDGLPQAVDAFNNKIPNVIKQAVKDNIHKVAQEIYSEAKARVPVDTGELEASIHMNTHEDTASVSADADYASYVDEGTSRMSAQPFLKEQATQIINELHRRIEEEITRRLPR